MARARKTTRAAATGPGRPRGSDGAETRRRIMVMAMKHVAERGYARATLREIAREAGLTGGTVFYYFPSKAELVTATFTELAEPVITQLRAAATAKTSFSEAYIAWLEAGVEVMNTYPHLASFVAAIGVAGEEDPSLRALHDRANDAQHRLVADLVAIGQRAGQFRDDLDSAAITDMLFAIMLGLTELAASTSADRFSAAMKAAVHLVDGTLIRPLRR